MLLAILGSLLGIFSLISLITLCKMTSSEEKFTEAYEAFIKSDNGQQVPEEIFAKAIKIAKYVFIVLIFVSLLMLAGWNLAVSAIISL